MRLNVFFCVASAACAWAAGPAAAKPTERLPTFFVAETGPMRQIAARFEVIQHLSGGYEVAVPETRVAELTLLYPAARPLRADLDEEVHSLTHAQPRDPDSMLQALKDFVAKYPDLVKLDTYGTSTEGRAEYVLTMAKNVASPDKTKPELMITSATHGDETITVEVTLGLIKELLEGYGTDARLTKMVDGHIIYWVPAVCVDGYAHESREVDGVDPNRDYPYPDDPSHQVSAKGIQDIMSFVDNLHPNIKGSIDYHAAASMIMFPWGYTTDHIPQPDYDNFDKLTGDMARANGFAHGDIAETIYVAPGSSADYYYWKHHTVSLGIEVSHRLTADAALDDDIIKENTESTWRFIENF